MVDVCMIVANGVRTDPRVQKEARALAAAGYSVAVIGATSGTDLAWEDAPGGYRVRRVPYGGFARRHAIKVALSKRAPRTYGSAIEVYRRLRGIAPPQPPAASPASPPLSFASKSDTYRHLESTLRAEQPLLAALAEAAALTLPGVIHCHDLDVLDAGARAARWTGAALVFDSHEIWWAQFADDDVPPEWVAHHQEVESRLIGEVDGVITVCDSIADFFADRYGIPRPRVVRNALETPPGGFLTPESLHPVSDPVRVLFHGGYSPGRGLEQLIDAARDFVGAELVLRGFGPLEAELRARVEREALADRVRFAEPVAMGEVVAAASTADIGVIPYRPTCLNNRFSTPNKLFEYLSAGLAVAASDLPELRRVIDREEVGAVFDPDDPPSIARAVNTLAADPQRLLGMRRRAAMAARDRQNWDHEVGALLELYREILPRSPVDVAKAFARRWL